MKFIEIVEGFSIRVDSIVSIKQLEDMTVVIETETREYVVTADFRMLMEALEEEEARKKNMERYTNQFFGG